MWNWRKPVRDLSNCLCWRNLGDLSYLPHSHRVWSLPHLPPGALASPALSHLCPSRYTGMRKKGFG